MYHTESVDSIPETVDTFPGNVDIDSDLTFFCMLAGINADEVPSTWPDRIKIPVRDLSAATKWWHEYGEENHFY